jgi:hypothetical protein
MTEANVLPQLIRRESRSFLQYARDAFPWSKGKDSETVARVQSMAAAEAAAIDSIAKLMIERRIGIPHLGSYPASFTSWNFIAVRDLIPKLTATERQGITAVECDLDMIADRDLRTRVEELLSIKRRNLEELQALGAA